MDLGIVRQTYDVISNELFFYSEDTLIYHISAKELHNDIDVNTFKIGSHLNIEMVKQIIANFDANKLSVPEFHQQIAHAGVVSVSLYLRQEKIYYMGQDAEYFLESYANI